MVVHRAGAGLRARSRARCTCTTIGAPNPPLTFTLKKGGAAGPTSALGGMAAKDLQADLAPPISSTTRRSGTMRSPRTARSWPRRRRCSVINLQIAAAYRNKKEYDNAIAAYNELLKADPTNDKAIVGIGMTNLEKGDLEGRRRRR